MNVHLERARLLYNQSRFDLAEREVNQALVQNPDDAEAHALRSHCLSRLQKKAEAIEAAERAIALLPGLPDGHAALADALLTSDRLSDAEGAAARAVEHDPFNANNFALLGLVRFNRRNWAGALEAAEQGLVLDAEHMGNANVRAMALVQLGRRGEAANAIAGALARDPEDALSHANQGWTALHAGEPRKALEHFREALRLEPNLDWARMGMVEALKARFLPYRLMLRFFLWMSRLGFGVQFGIVVGLFLAQRFLVRLAEENPAAAPYAWPMAIALMVFVVLTWTADPVFNLLLRLSRFGRYALSREQTVASNWVGLCVLVAVATLIVGIVHSDERWLLAAFLSALMMMNVAGIWKVPAGRQRLLLMLGALALAGAAIAGISVWFALEGLPRFRKAEMESLAQDLMLAFIYGTLAFGWIVNGMLIAHARR